MVKEQLTLVVTAGLDRKGSVFCVSFDADVRGQVGWVSGKSCLSASDIETNFGI